MAASEPLEVSSRQQELDTSSLHQSKVSFGNRVENREHKSDIKKNCFHYSKRELHSSLQIAVAKKISLQMVNAIF